MRRQVKFWLLFILGCCLFIPPFLIAIATQIHRAVLSLYGILFTSQFLMYLAVYCYLIYRNVYKRKPPTYPLSPPQGRMTDHYFPRTRIPRPIYEDARRYSDAFTQKQMKRWTRKRKEKRKNA